MSFKHETKRRASKFLDLAFSEYLERPEDRNLHNYNGVYKDGNNLLKLFAAERILLFQS